MRTIQRTTVRLPLLALPRAPASTTLPSDLVNSYASYLQGHTLDSFLGITLEEEGGPKEYEGKMSSIGDHNDGYLR